MKKGTKLDHTKLAKRHLSHLSDEELEKFKFWITTILTDRAVLRYADARILERFNKNICLPKLKKGFVTFKRFDKP